MVSEADSASGDQTIQFAPGLTSGGPATLTLDGVAIEVNHPSSGTLTIQGPTNNPLTITQNTNVSYTIGDFGDFQIDAGTTAVINNLTITGAYKSYDRDIDANGGAIESSGALTVNDCTIADNTAARGGGIYQFDSAPLIVNNSTITGNVAEGGAGGGIFAENVSIYASTISDNAAGFGGGLYAGGNLTVVDSTISGNTARTAGAIGHGGGYLNVTSTTIAYNYATYDAGIFTGANSTISDSTISGNSCPNGADAVYNAVSFEYGGTVIRGSIIAGDHTGDSFDLIGFFGVSNDVIEDGYIPGPTTLDPGYTFSNQAVIWGTGPGVAPLGYYRGPTETMPLLPGSPALDAYQSASSGGISRSATDQRGFPMGDDLGAVQTQDNPLEVNTVQDDPVGLGQLSLRDAVNLANANGGDQTISFDPSLFSSGPATINLTQGALPLDDTNGTITLNGGSSGITINPTAGGMGVFSVGSTTTEQLAIEGIVSIGGSLTATTTGADNLVVEVQNGGDLQLQSSTTLAGLTIAAGGMVQQTSANTTFGSEVLTLGSLSISNPTGSTNGGVLDLGNGDLILEPGNTALISGSSSIGGYIEQLLAAGYDGGLWDGVNPNGGLNPAAIISAGAANDPRCIEALGYGVVGTDPGELNLTTYDGQNVSPGQTIVALTYYGDANLDRQVNSIDYGMIGYTYPGTNTQIGGWTGGDFDYLGAVGTDDLIEAADVGQDITICSTHGGAVAIDNTTISRSGKVGGDAIGASNVTVPNANGNTPKLELKSVKQVRTGVDHTGDVTLQTPTTQKGNTWTFPISSAGNMPDGDYIVTVDVTSNGQTVTTTFILTVATK